jgi:hypothetical protein
MQVHTPRGVQVFTDITHSLASRLRVFLEAQRARLELREQKLFWRLAKRSGSVAFSDRVDVRRLI